MKRKFKIIFSESGAVSKYGVSELYLIGCLNLDGKEYKKYKTLKMSLSDNDRNNPTIPFNIPTPNDIEIFRSEARKQIEKEILAQIEFYKSK